MSDVKFESEFNQALVAKGNQSGYQNISEWNVNGYKTCEYAGKPSELKNITYGSSTEWTEYPPINLKDMVGSNVTIDHFRIVTAISPNNSTVNYILIYTDDPNTNLYTTEINQIINSLSAKKKNNLN